MTSGRFFRPSRSRGEDGKPTRLTELELDFFFLVLTVAGSETTRNAISAGLVALLEHPEQLEMLRRNPEAIPVAVEEILCAGPHRCPTFAVARSATPRVAGMPIAKNDRITLWYPSANRDERAFDDPFRFDITRTPESARRVRRRWAPHLLGVRISLALRSGCFSRSCLRALATSSCSARRSTARSASTTRCCLQ